MEFAVQIKSDADCITNIEKAVKLFLETLSLSNILYDNVFLCLMEASINAYFHGNKQNANKLVYVKIEIDKQNIKILVKDMGEGFDYNRINNPKLPENIEKPHGRGLFIISELSDKFEYNKKGNELVITFKR